MKRIQVQLTEEQHQRLSRWARARGISLSEAVRLRAALAIAGKYADEDGCSRVARDHDEHLARL